MPLSVSIKLPCKVTVLYSKQWIVTTMEKNKSLLKGGKLKKGSDLPKNPKWISGKTRGAPWGWCTHWPKTSGRERPFCKAWKQQHLRVCPTAIHTALPQAEIKILIQKYKHNWKLEAIEQQKKKKRQKKQQKNPRDLKLSIKCRLPDAVNRILSACKYTKQS